MCCTVCVTILFFRYYEQRFSCYINNVIDGHVNHILNRYIRNLVVDSQLHTACFVDELINIRDNISPLSHSVVFTRTEITDIIQLVWTS